MANINPNKNDNLAFLRGIDLQELLVQVENLFLEYRDKLNLPEELTFGVEIEYEGKIRTLIDYYIKNNLDNWNSKDDGSLDSGGEITSPIMTDEIKYWEQLKGICDYLTEKHADTLHKAGGHVHIGASILGEDVEAWKLFLKLYIAYENVLFRFVYGDKISGREELLKYAPPIASDLYLNLSELESAHDLYDINRLIYLGRRAALNFKNVKFLNNRNEKNTIEFRSPNATTSAVIWQNNINTFAKMLMSAKQKAMDEEFLDYKLKNEFKPYKGHETLYNNVNLKNALEFVDLVFENNVDKLYFLRQYIKDFQTNFGINGAVRARRFVK